MNALQQPRVDVPAPRSWDAEPLVTVLTPEQLAQSWQSYHRASLLAVARSSRSRLARWRCRVELRRPTWTLHYSL